MHNSEEIAKKTQPFQHPLFEGNIQISEEVMAELTKKTIQGIPFIQTANMGLASKFVLGRKVSEGVRVTLSDGNPPCVVVDAYVLIRYGRRIPDLAWDVQEKIKANLERYTGYTVKAVNITVQGIYIDEPPYESDSSMENSSTELPS